jgi:hypothetical protein
MGVFIGWSGKNTKSYMVAIALRSWLEQVVQNCSPWVSAQDIDAGERWATELFTQLDKHSVGIICVTKENQAEPWLNFEAGALAKQLKGDKADESRVCPLLIEMTESDVSGPLMLLQMVLLERDGVFRVLQTVNKYTIQNPLPEEVLRKVFDKWWPDLVVELQKMNVPEQPGKSSRSQQEMLEEILSLVRSIDKATSPIIAVREKQNWTTLVEKSVAESIKSKLIAEVGPVVATFLETASPEFADDIFTLKFPLHQEPVFNALTNPPYLNDLKQATGKLSQHVKLACAETLIDL